MVAPSAKSPRPPSSTSIPHETTSLEQMQVKLIEALHELQKDCDASIPKRQDAIHFVQKALTLVGDPDDSTEAGPVDWPTFAARLRERRMAAKMSQEGLAEKLGVTATTIRNIESQRRRPGRGLMLKLLSSGSRTLACRVLLAC